MIGTNTGNQAPNELIIILATILIVSLIVLCIYMAPTSRKRHKKQMKKLKGQGINNQVYLDHVNGLSLPADIRCKISSYADRIEIEANNMKFNLYKKDIVNAYLKTDIEITSQYVSSAGGAAAGAMMYGPLGAIIGGRVKEKKNRETSRYLIITYNNDNKLNFICFDATPYVPSIVNKLLKEIQSELSNDKKVVDL